MGTSVQNHNSPLKKDEIDYYQLSFFTQKLTNRERAIASLTWSTVTRRPSHKSRAPSTIPKSRTAAPTQIRQQVESVAIKKAIGSHAERVAKRPYQSTKLTSRTRTRRPSMIAMALKRHHISRSGARQIKKQMM